MSSTRARCAELRSCRPKRVRTRWRSTGREARSTHSCRSRIARQCFRTAFDSNTDFQGEPVRYQLKQIQCKPWTLNGLSLPLIESHYENNYGGALRRLNAITEQLESLDLAKTPGHVLNSLKREQLIALNSTLLHELYFASLGGDGRKTTKGIGAALERDFGSYLQWRREFSAMGYALGGGSG